MICPKQQELMAVVQDILTHLAELARAEAEAVQYKTENTWMEIDRQIERAIGQKERAIGALRQHMQEHGC